MEPEASATAVRTARRGTAALTTLWQRLGLDVDEPQVLSNRGSLMVRMPRAGLVARVSTHTGAQRRDPGWWLATEVAVGRIAHAAGAAVVPPAQVVDAGPHEVDGLWVSLWTDVGSDDTRAIPAESAAALADWHRKLVDAGRDLPVLTVAHQVITEPLSYAARHGFLDAAELAALTREHEEALAGIEGLGTQEVLLHGDAHRGNLLRDGAGLWRWSDLEESCRGPIEWDLAVLGSTPTVEAGRAGLTAYAILTGRPVPSQEELAPWLRLRALEGNAWAIGCAVTFPERYAGPARRYVDEVVERTLNPRRRP
ncbi:phosphotransferase family protein [Ornithinimicrobium cryptoxanthini]|uniref:Aminoglycoside phosphotransferase family protein n=1 Tax=Ornithinimicrobium cryptoxanthini TaxID=2934161 RepID=A0ABY4YL16_9MICO|nr:phosphotransferase [Ornithinimicrobium cryptoxanthini]USQ77384.1 aminoglycoside phosphotransferase family protein [Ornithinimicrobium cryptoxanthini]